MTARTYPSAAAFKQALEQRLRASSQGGTALTRARRMLVFDRFLARVAAVLGEAVTLKGGLVLELRLEKARTTIDVDLRMMGSPAEIFTRLQEAARQDLGDYLSFEVKPAPDHAKIQNDGMQYEGLRFRAECRLAGKLYGDPFGVDVGFGDPILGEPEVRVAKDVLAFAGIAPPVLRLYPVETHIAEKVHAYTLPRARPNTRVKDLPDLALLATAGSLHAGRLRQALELTFNFRNTHPLPVLLPEPSQSWTVPYADLALEDSLPWKTLAEVTAAAQSFLNPVLSGALDAAWSPSTWTWGAP
jgi:hypothetical protein